MKKEPLPSRNPHGYWDKLAKSMRVGCCETFISPIEAQSMVNAMIKNNLKYRRAYIRESNTTKVWKVAI